MRLIPSLFALLLLFAACAGPDDPAGEEGQTAPPPEATNTLADLDFAGADLTIFHTALVQAGFDDNLRTGGPYTVFAPTDSAFHRMTGESIQLLLDARNRDRLREILSYHMIDGSNLGSDAISGSLQFMTTMGQALIVTAQPDGITVADAHGDVYNVVTPDVRADNGVIHVIDGVLMPAEAGAIPDTSAVLTGE